MTEIIERAEVARILADPHFLVPEADAAATSSFDRFRALASRFANGASHEARRGRLERMLAALDPDELAESATAHTRNALAVRATERVDVASIARSVPVASLAAALGFRDPESLPPLVAAIAGRYAGGAATDATADDLAIVRLLAAAPRDADDDARALRVQLLVQAFAATAALVEGAMQKLEASVAVAPSSTGGPTTRDLLLTTLRDESPVPITRRVGPDGAVVVLRLDGPDGESGALRAEPRILAFGAGPRACPASHHALAIAAAIVDELRRARAHAATSIASKPEIHPEETAHAEAR